MRHLKLLALLLVSCYLSAQAPADKLVAEGQSSPALEKRLRALTDDIGGRVGTPAMDDAVQSGVNAFKAAGGENVHTGPASMAASWTEGKWTAWTSAKRGRTR